MFPKTGAVAWTFNGLAVRSVHCIPPSLFVLERTDAIAQGFTSSLSNGSLDESVTEAAKA